MLLLAYSKEELMYIYFFLNWNRKKTKTKQGKNISLSLKIPLPPFQALYPFPYIEHNIDNQVFNGKSHFSQVKAVTSAEQKRKRWCSPALTDLGMSLSLSDWTASPTPSVLFSGGNNYLTEMKHFDQIKP